MADESPGRTWRNQLNKRAIGSLWLFATFFAWTFGISFPECILAGLITTVVVVAAITLLFLFGGRVPDVGR